MKHKNHRDHLTRESQHNGSTVGAFISGMGMGAGIMYALDPDRGNRRRAMAQQRLFRLVHLTGDAVDKGVRDLEHRASGLVAEAMCLVSDQQVPDDVLEQRVRSKLGRIACHPSSIEVSASGGRVTLTGPVLRGEAEHIARAVRHVRGVRGVEHRLEEHDASENVPGLQGRSERTGDKPELLQENWAPGTRLVMGGIGLMLMLRALRKPGFLNAITGVLGLGLVTRSGRDTRVVDTLMDSIKPAAGSRAGARESRAQKAGERSGAGRRDEVGRSGVYPGTGPFPAGDVEVRTPGSFGGGSYEEHGTSELTYRDRTVVGALSGEREGGSRATVGLAQLLKPGEVPKERWISFFDELDKGLNGERVTVEVRENGQSRVAQRDIPIDGFGADTKDRENIVNISVGRSADDMVVHNIPARRVSVREDRDRRVLEVEGTDGRVISVAFRNQDLQRSRVVA